MDEQTYQEFVAFLAGVSDSNNWAMGRLLEAQDEAAEDGDDDRADDAAEQWGRCDKIDDLIGEIERILPRFGHKQNWDYQAVIQYPGQRMISVDKHATAATINYTLAATEKK